MKKKAQEKYWFPAKRYGYGWGLPNAWQGRLVFLGYLAAVLLSCVFLERREIPSWFFPLHIFLLALFVLHCLEERRNTKVALGRTRTTTQTRTAMISINDLHKTYGKTKALNGIHLEVEQGELFAFLGPNGAGKNNHHPHSDRG